MRKVAVVAFVAGLLALVGTTLAMGRVRPVRQPIAFNHRLHLEQDLKCTDCHAGAERGLVAGFPPVKGCMLCHLEPRGAHPDEPLVRQYAERGEEVPWVRVHRAPGHVHFSHRAHVKFEGLECEACHPGMPALEEPVGVPRPGLVDMDACMACHQERGASNDCLVCHK